MASNTKLFKRFQQSSSEDKIPFLLNLNRYWRRKLLSRLKNEKIANTLAYSDEADAAACLDILPSPRREAIIKLLHENKREKVRRLLSFAPQTAGRLINTNFIEVKKNTPKKDITAKVQKHYQIYKKAPTIIVEEKNGRIIGRLPLELLVISDWRTPETLRPARIKKIRREEPSAPIPTARLKPLPAVKHTLDQEKLIQKIAGTAAEMIAVVDKENRTLGIIHTHDLINILKQEATEDFYQFAGLPPEEHVFDPPLRSVKLRLSWLIVNLFTVLLAAAVVAAFKETLSQVVILAAFMPVVAGMGGNAGTQTLAVMVRGIAAGEIKGRSARWVVLKEISAGVLNGIITGIIVAAVAVIWQGSPLLGAVMFLSMVINLFVAGLFGATIPLALKAFRIDPAVASSIFITTATDVLGFLTFLSLATWLLA